MSLFISSLNISDISINTLVKKDLIRVYILVAKVMSLLVLLFSVIVPARAWWSETFLDTDTTISKLQGAIAEVNQENDASKASKRRRHINYSKIVKRNIFGPLTSSNTQTKKSDKNLVVTSEPLILIGTFISKGSPPYAIIENEKSKSQDVYNIGEEVSNSASLKAIFPTYVELEQNGKTEVLSLDDTSNNSNFLSDSPGSDITISSDDLSEALDNLPLLLTQARAVPYFQDGKPVGLRLFAIRGNSLYDKLGLKNGDILKSINGNQLGNLSEAVKLFETLKEERDVDVILQRNKEEETFRYHIR